MSPEARRALVDVAAAGSAMYPDPEAFELKSVLAEVHHLESKQIVVGCGSDELIHLCARAFLGETDSTVISQYSFASYKLAIEAMGAEVVIVPANGYEPDLSAMLEGIRRDTKLLYLANPNNPTGTFHGLHAVKTFLMSVPRRVVVVLDEAYSEYLQDEDKTDLAGLIHLHPNLVVLRTFSKAYGLAALRIGFAATSPELAGILNRLRLPFNTSSLAQAAAVAALGDTHHLLATREANFLALAQLRSGISALGLTTEGVSGNFVMMHVDNAIRIYERLLAKGIIVRPLMPYGLRDWLRISCGLPQDNARFLRTLTTLL